MFQQRQKPQFSAFLNDIGIRNLTNTDETREVFFSNFYQIFDNHEKISRDGNFTSWNEIIIIHK